MPTLVILTYCLPSHYLFCYVTSLYIIWFVILSFSTSAVMVCYLPPCQLSCYIIFFHISCPATLPSSTSVVLPLYLLPHQLSCHITYHHNGFIQAFLGAFAKLQKQLLGLSCLSFGLYGTAWLPLDGFS